MYHTGAKLSAMQAARPHQALQEHVSIATKHVSIATLKNHFLQVMMAPSKKYKHIYTKCINTFSYTFG